MAEKIKIGVKYGFINLFTSLLMLLFIMVFQYLAGYDFPLQNPAPGADFFDMVIFAPLIEEFAFRLLPIAVIMVLTNNKTALWVVIIISSVIFGYIHGAWYNIFIQGVSGVVLSLAYLKGGYVSSVTAHATHNGVLYAISAI